MIVRHQEQAMCADGMVMRQKKKNELLTEVELEFMSELWELGEGTVRDVLDRLPAGRNLAYTSAATVLRILEQKEFVTSRRDGKRHVFVPTLAKDAYQTRSLKDLSVKLFDDTPASLVARLVDDEDLTQEALGQIRALLDRRLKNGSG
jgi:BlaI family transcriptional regulator, penicillinase repressor